MKRAFRVAMWQVASGRGDVVRRERSLVSPLSTLNPAPTRRGGAALIVVLSLLTTLTFLGLLAYRFANQEFITSQNYALEPTATPTISGIPEFGLKQLIVGTPDRLGNSALHGSNFALVPNMIGRPNTADDRLPLQDVNPFDGQGIGVWADNANLATGGFFFDYDGDGFNDAAGDFLDQDNFILNFSPAANGGTAASQATLFQPDAGYTYPDANSLYLAYDGIVRDPNNPNEMYRVVIPSFHRPQYFPAERLGGFASIYTDVATKAMVLRPHQSHVNVADGSTSRFLSSGPTTALSGDTTRVINDFPFTVDIDTSADVNDPGVWSTPDTQTSVADASDPSLNIYEYDVDCDGDGIRDAIWMDLDYPIVTLPDGRQFVPLYAFKVVDMDALLNVNAHGNMNNFVQTDASGQAIDGTVTRNDLSLDYLSASHDGLSRSEVNLGLGLTADPGTDLDSGVTLTEAQEQHAANLFDTEVDDTLLTTALTPAELSNIELLMLLHGRGQWQDVALGTAKLWTGNVHGRLGDQDRILDFYAWLESNGLASAYFGATAGPPAPGTYPFSQVRLDDDADSNVASDDEVNAPPFRPLGGASYQDPDLGFTGGAPPHIAPYVPPFVHPLDYGGTGVNSLQTVGTSPNERIVRVFKAADGGLGLTNNPSAWLDYSLSPWQYQELPAGAIIGTDTLFGAAPYWSAVSGGLQANNPLHDFLIDEQNEVILDRRFARPEDDAVFSASEIEGLQLSSTDFDNLGASNRLRNLGIVNFDKTNTSMGREIRSRFTTESWDRLDFSIPPNADRSWEFTTWSGTNDFAATQLTFPPEFGSVDAGTPADPIRPELRLLLKTEFQYSDHLNPNDTSAKRYPRHRLWINRLLSDDTHSTNVAHAAFDGDGNPQFRNLTPHPNLVALDAIDTGTDMSPIAIPAMEHQNLSFGTAPALAPPFDNISIDPNGAGVTDVDRALLATAQEWWARYDRQRLARDIYVMLWLLGGGVDDTLSPYTQTAGLYSDSQIKEMAQFAVNVVDAMDRDSVITHFEYDKNLTDGWNISGGNSPLHADYATVDGVEAQQLTFSEALWIREPEITGAAMSSDNDHDATLYDDRTGDHHHLFIELRNGTPFPVRFNNDAWRIRVAGLPSSTILDNTITPQRGNALTAKFVGPGENFLIGTHDGESHVIGGVNDGQIRASTFRVDYDDDFTFETIVPYRDDPNAPSGSDLAEAREDYPDPLVDLDLCHSRDIMTESFAEHGNVPGYFIDAATFTDAEMVLVLERRRTLHGEGLINYTSDPWGGWIEVDRMTVDRRDFLLEYDDDPADIYDTTDGSGLLAALLSQERPEPLFADNAQFDTQNDAKGLRDYIGGNLLYRHTLGSPDVTYTNADPTMQPMANSNRDHQKNSQNLATGSSVFTLWQPHFDRDFSSVMELLSVPLLSPSELIYRDRQSMTIESGLSQPNSFVLSNSHTAGIRFQNPFLDLNFDGTRDEDLNGDSLFDEKDDNRWYRLLEFLTTEEGGEDTIREENNNIVRDPGRINLNTLRHESVLAAILDDPHIERFATIPFMTTDALDNARNWYNELQLARDGIDPISGLSLPGVPGMPFNAQGVSPQQVGAIPIRSASYVAPDLSDAVNSASWPNASNVNKAAHTILRRHVATTSPVTVPDKHQLGLFEARQTSDVNSDNVDYHTRNRLLAKLANQTTNRSNVFAVWMTVKYFEAHQPDATNQPNVVQIGAELADSPTLRRFYVVDRTLLEDAVQVDDNGTPGTPSDDIMTLNWRSFVVHQRTLPSN